MTDQSRKPLQRRLAGITGHVPSEQPVIFAGIRNYFNPKTYEALMAEEVPSYGRLQEQVAAATIRREVARIIDLGTGTGVTARRVLNNHALAKLVGIDESPEMLAAARHVLPTETDLRVARLEDPLPPGPFDLAVSALAVHHLDGAGKADLFRRIAKILAPGARFVLGDLIVPDDPRDVITAIDGVHDRPSTLAEQLAWLRVAGFVATTVWVESDLAVLVGDL
ncbi:MAG: methyltransferase domain-containing protein [Steroidobacteraceae bacterium]